MNSVEFTEIPKLFMAIETGKANCRQYTLPPQFNNDRRFLNAFIDYVNGEFYFKCIVQNETIIFWKRTEYYWCNYALLNYLGKLVHQDLDFIYIAKELPIIDPAYRYPV